MKEKSQFHLLCERRFGPFFGVQFLGAFNDNLFKQALVILLAYHLWNSLFARNREKLRALGRLSPRIRLAVGPAVAPQHATPESLHATVLGLRGRWK